jgi:hypothetical protein
MGMIEAALKWIVYEVTARTRPVNLATAANRDMPSEVN